MFVMSTGGLLHTEVCIGLDIAHFPSLMYGFIMQQIYIRKLTKLSRVNVRDMELLRHLSQGLGQPVGTRSPWPLHDACNTVSARPRTSHAHGTCALCSSWC